MTLPLGRVNGYAPVFDADPASGGGFIYQIATLTGLPGDSRVIACKHALGSRATKSVRFSRHVGSRKFLGRNEG